MSLNLDKNLKAYYSITEVSEMFNINATTLRFWEKQFPMLRPRTLGNKKRMYTESDIATIRLIYNLVKVRGFKIAAARKMIQVNRAGADKSQQVIDSLTAVRDELKELKRHLDGLV